MADCIECGRVVDELGYKCNHCGREVCWDHRRPGEHDCRPGGAATPDPAGSLDRDAVARSRRAGTVEREREATGVDDHIRPRHGAEPVEEYGFEDRRSYPWWVYVLVAGLFVFPSLVAGAFAIL